MTTTSGFKLTSASNVTFDGNSGATTPGPCGDPAARNWHLTYTGTVSSTAACITFWDSSTFCAVKNMMITGATNATTGTSGIAFYTYTKDVTVSNCEIYTGLTGIVSMGVSASSIADVAPNWDKRYTIQGNDIHDVLQNGINMSNLELSTFTCNTVHDVNYPSTAPQSSTRTSGIRLFNCRTTTVERNTIRHVHNLRTDASISATGRTYGIRIQVYPLFVNPDFDGIPGGNRIINNCLSDIKSDGITNIGLRDIGIEVGGSRYDTVYHNTVSMEGVGTDGSACVYIFGNRGGLATYAHTIQSAFQIHKNNIYSNTRTGSAENSCIREEADGTSNYDAQSDYNVLYSPNGKTSPGYTSVFDWRTSYPTHPDAHSVGYNPFLTADRCHFDPTQPSSANNLCVPIPNVSSDIDGDTRPASLFADAGADEEATVAPLYHDAFVISLDAPSAGGVPQGLSFSPIIASVGNSTQNPEAAVNANIKIYDPSSVLVYDQTSANVPLGALGTVQVSTTLNWVPATIGLHTALITLSMAGDGNIANNTLTVPFLVVGKKTPGYCTSFENVGELESWTADGDFALGSTVSGNTKLGGAHTGNTCFVTVPGGSSTLYVTATVSHLYTPFFDLSSVATGYVSFFHSIKTQPKWDRSFFEYSIDTGKTWRLLGALNDPDGVNWYSENLYQNAQSGTDGGSCMDTALWNSKIGLPLPSPGWTSDGDCIWNQPTGPYGYMYSQYNLGNLAPAVSPLGRTYVRFRYTTFSDAFVANNGWAIDDFCLTTSARTFTGSICGVNFEDINGNGVLDPGEFGKSGTIVLSYFGQEISRSNTNDGNYCFNNLLPGNYTLTSVSSTGWAVTTSGVVSQNGSQAIIFNIGNYQGSISGMVWEDMDKDGAKEAGEPGLAANFEIVLHRDSCNGIILGTTRTEPHGNYIFAVGPGNYYLRETNQTGYDQTYPAGNCHAVTVSGPSGAPSANITGVDFGNFKRGQITVNNYVDLNGNGVRDGGDVTPMPVGAIAVVRFAGPGIDVLDTLGNGYGTKIHAGLGVGLYTATEVFTSPGWVRTYGAAGFSFTVGFSGAQFSCTFMNFKPPFASGKVFHDVNANGVKNAGEPGLPNWSVQITGNMYGPNSAVTDANGNWTIENIGPGSHVISEVPQAGWTQTFPVSVSTYSFDATSANVLGADQTDKDFGNAPDSVVPGNIFYRTALPEEWARARNAAGKPNAIKCKPYSVYFQFTFVAPAAADRFTLKFSMRATGTITRGTQKIDVVGSFINNDDPYVREIISAGDTFQVEGYGHKGKRMSANVIWNTLPRATTVKVPAESFIVNQPRLPMPNLVNVGEELKRRLVSDAHPFMFTTGAPRDSHSVIYLKYNDIQKSFIKISRTGELLHNIGPSRCLDFFNDRYGNPSPTKPIKKQQRGLPPNIHNNRLFAEALALRLNILASDSGIFPAGFGDLLFDDHFAPFTGTLAFTKLSARQIMARVDSFLSCQPVSGGLDAYNCFWVCYALNRAFSCPVDTASWSCNELVLNGCKALKDVWYLHANVGGIQSYIAPVEQSIMQVMPSAFHLSQNFPNPFNPTTTINFELAQPSLVTLKVYNSLGQEVAILLDREEMYEGEQEAEFDASRLSSGVYFYRLVAEGIPDEDAGTLGQRFTEVKKMLFIK
jgi:hypothetical protein